MQKALWVLTLSFLCIRKYHFRRGTLTEGEEGCLRFDLVQSSLFKLICVVKVFSFCKSLRGGQRYQLKLPLRTVFPDFTVQFLDNCFGGN